jgi:hypothetical protein
MNRRRRRSMARDAFVGGSITGDDSAVKLRGIPCWTEQVDPEEITAELD